jgi:aminoglycoside phosphotransferase family enzyme
VQVPLQDAVSTVKELDQYMDSAVEGLKGLFQVAVYYHTRQLCHALTAEMLVWTVKVRYIDPVKFQHNIIFMQLCSSCAWLLILS